MRMNEEVLLLHSTLFNALKDVSDPSWWLRSSAVGVNARHWARDETLLGGQLAHFLSNFETLACSCTLSLAAILHPALKPGRALIHPLGGKALESGQKALDDVKEHTIEQLGCDGFAGLSREEVRRNERRCTGSGRQRGWCGRTVQNE